MPPDPIDLLGAPIAPAPRKRGRKRLMPKDEQRRMVEGMAGYGVPHEAIADIVGIDRKTLGLRFRAELDRGVAVANLKVAQNMFKIATGPGREAVSAGKYWLSCRAGWTEYAPPPGDRPASQPPMGKKDAAQLAAETAEAGTGWENLVH